MEFVRDLVRELPLAPWAREAVAAGTLLVLLVLLARWLPTALRETYSNWASLLRDALGIGSPGDVSAIVDRRSGQERRSGTDRRRVEVPVAIERRSGIDRRQ